MRLNRTIHTAALAVLTVLVAGCARDPGDLEPAPATIDPVVFDDTFGANVDFQAFAGSKLDALSIDGTQHFQGTASLKVVIPAGGPFAGGAFTTNVVRDLTGYNALVFYARASAPTVLDIAGLGNDNTGTSLYEASWSNISLTTAWQRFVIPIPRPDRLAYEGGLFFFAEGTEGVGEHTVWFDEIVFDTVGGIANPRPAMATSTVSTFVGATVVPTGCQTIFDVGGADQRIQHMSGYFDFFSNNTDVATVTDGVILAVGAGTAVISGKLSGVDVSGQVTVMVTAPPATPAPTPVHPAADVISLFSDSYPDVPVDTWSADWDLADVTLFKIAGNETRAYRNLVYAGIEFTSNPIDASAMTHFHIDVWVPGGSTFRVKLVDFGADGQFGGGDDREQELAFTPATTPAIAIKAWAGLDIPLANFTNLTTRGHVAQLILSGDVGTAYVDNIYFHK